MHSKVTLDTLPADVLKEIFAYLGTTCVTLSFMNYLKRSYLYLVRYVDSHVHQSIYDLLRLILTYQHGR
jgi:hypothetical protein